MCNEVNCVVLIINLLIQPHVRISNTIETLKHHKIYEYSLFQNLYFINFNNKHEFQSFRMLINIVLGTGLVIDQRAHVGENLKFIV